MSIHTETLFVSLVNTNGIICTLKSVQLAKLEQAAADRSDSDKYCVIQKL